MSWSFAELDARREQLGREIPRQPREDPREAGRSHDDGPPPQDDDKPLKPTPFKLRPGSEIPPRQWLYGGHMIRGFVSLTVSPGGLGKSSMLSVEALAMASGRDLLGHRPSHALRVWLWNGEDPREEVERRITAACLHHGIEAEDLADRLMMDSGRDVPINLATLGGDGLKVARPLGDHLIDTIRASQIDVLVIDPFVTSHECAENDTAAINAVASEWRRIADKAGCAVELVHHVNKAAAMNSEGHDIYGSRGAGALIDAVRSGRVLHRMKPEDATKFGVEDEAALYFYVTKGKANMATPEMRVWRRMVGVALGNGCGNWPDGDHVGVCTEWTPPDPMEGVSIRDLQRVQVAIEGSADAPRQNEQSGQWVGYLIADALKLDVAPGVSKGERTGLQNTARAKVRHMLKSWIAAGALVIDHVKDKQASRDVKIIQVGDPVTEADIKGKSNE